jgi:hypothetical protein
LLAPLVAVEEVLCFAAPLFVPAFVGACVAVAEDVAVWSVEALCTVDWD